MLVGGSDTRWIKHRLITLLIHCLLWVWRYLKSFFGRYQWLPGLLLTVWCWRERIYLPIILTMFDCIGTSRREKDWLKTAWAEFYDDLTSNDRDDNSEIDCCKADISGLKGHDPMGHDWRWIKLIIKYTYTYTYKLINNFTLKSRVSHLSLVLPPKEMGMCCKPKFPDMLVWCLCRFPKLLQSVKK